MGEDTVITSYQRPLQRVKVRRDGWTKEKRERFLAELTDSCNVRLALRVVGMAARNAYLLRRRDPEFAARWEEALRLGYERLEAAVLHQALGSVNAIDVAGLAEARDAAGAPAVEGEDVAGAARASVMAETPVTPEAMKIAMAVLDRAARQMAGPPAKRHGQATREETDAALTREIRKLLRKRDRTTR